MLIPLFHAFGARCARAKQAGAKTIKKNSGRLGRTVELMLPLVLPIFHNILVSAYVFLSYYLLSINPLATRSSQRCSVDFGPNHCLLG